MQDPCRRTGTLIIMRNGGNIVLEQQFGEVGVYTGVALNHWPVFNTHSAKSESDMATD